MYFVCVRRTRARAADAAASARPKHHHYYWVSRCIKYSVFMFMGATQFLPVDLPCVYFIFIFLIRNVSLVAALPERPQNSSEIKMFCEKSLSVTVSAVSPSHCDNSLYARSQYFFLALCCYCCSHVVSEWVWCIRDINHTLASCHRRGRPPNIN